MKAGRRGRAGLDLRPTRAGTVPAPGRPAGPEPSRGRSAAPWLALALTLGLSCGVVSGAGVGAGGPAVFGTPAPASVTRELRSAVARAVERFEARDVTGVLAHVSDQYRTGPLTKPGLREHLVAIYGVYDAVRARIRIDEVRMVNGYAWVYSSGEVSGQLPLVGAWIVFLSWQRELEVARREAGAWRLFGYQQ